MCCAHCCNACRQALSLGANSNTIEKHSDACAARLAMPSASVATIDHYQVTLHLPIHTATRVQKTRTCESNSIASAASCGVSSAAS
jgi:hypothetical protein